jgi:ATP-binding cassette subfamily B protein
MYTIISNPATNLLLNIGLTAVVLVGAYRVNAGAIKPGVIIAFLQYFNMILMATMGITRIFIMWAKGEASAQRIANVLATEPELQVEAGSQPQEAAPHIEFQNVTFSYTGIGTNVEDLSFRLEHGQTLGILGSIGSGKSTILALLLRLYDPDAGQILIDGRDIRTIDAQELRSLFGTVFQNDFILEGTIADNIRFFRGISDARLEEAAGDAQAEFIAQKEGGMEAPVQVRGNNLSGGQKQRLLIARALAADPDILILDDASSALDYRTDAQLRRALRENYRHTTTVLVAQRVSSIRHADLILMLHDGNVIGQGDHETLMNTCEEYAFLAQTQMGEAEEVL